MATEIGVDTLAARLRGRTATRIADRHASAWSNFDRVARRALSANPGGLLSPCHRERRRQGQQPPVTAVHTGRPPAMTALLVETPESAVGTSSGSGSL